MKKLFTVLMFWLVAGAASASVPSPEACEVWAEQAARIALARDAGSPLAEVDAKNNEKVDRAAQGKMQGSIIKDKQDEALARGLPKAIYSSKWTPEQIAKATYGNCMSVAVKNQKGT